MNVELPPTTYNLFNKKGMKRQFKFNFDLFAFAEGTNGYNTYV